MILTALASAAIIAEKFWTQRASYRWSFRMPFEGEEVSFFWCFHLKEADIRLSKRFGCSSAKTPDPIAGVTLFFPFRPSSISYDVSYIRLRMVHVGSHRRRLFSLCLVKRARSFLIVLDRSNIDDRARSINFEMELVPEN